MRHKNGLKVTITDTERWTITRTVKREIRIEPITGQNKNTATAPTVTVYVEVRQDAGNHVAQDV